MDYTNVRITANNLEYQNIRVKIEDEALWNLREFFRKEVVSLRYIHWL